MLPVGGGGAPGPPEPSGGMAGQNPPSPCPSPPDPPPKPGPPNPPDGGEPLPPPPHEDAAEKPSGMPMSAPAFLRFVGVADESTTRAIRAGPGGVTVSLVSGPFGMLSQFVLSCGNSGECQGSCRMCRHAAVRACTSRSSLVGLSRTVVTGVQLRVVPLHRAGFVARAAS
jgi:hypothetical protein